MPLLYFNSKTKKAIQLGDELLSAEGFSWEMLCADGFVYWQLAKQGEEVTLFDFEEHMALLSKEEQTYIIRFYL